jgi:hypothetical protein
MTTREIEILLKFHADELDHIQRTILAMKTNTLRLIEFMEDEAIEPRQRGKSTVAKG